MTDAIRCANTALPCERTKESHSRGWSSGYCERCRQRLRLGTPLDRPAQRRRGAPMEESLVRDLITGCLLWTAGLHSSGYGKFQGHRVHVVVWERANGPVPEGMVVCHTCDVPRCAELSHLWVGTRADNSADMVAKGRQQRGSMKSTAKLSEKDIPKIRADTRGDIEVAKDFGVGPATIWSVRRKKSWAWVP